MALKGKPMIVDTASTNTAASVMLGENTPTGSVVQTVSIGYKADGRYVHSVAIGNNAAGTGVNIGTNTQGSSSIFSTTLGHGARTSSDAVCLGKSSYGYNSTGLSAMALGASSNSTGDRTVAIGYGAVNTTTNTILIGGTNITKVYIKGSTELTSDILDKINVTRIANGALDFIIKIKPITYRYNYRQDYQKKEEWFSQKFYYDTEIGDVEICNISKKERDKRFKYGGLGSYNKEDWSLGLKKKDELSAGFSAQEVKQILQETYGNKYNDLLISDTCEKYTDEELQQDNIERQYSMATGNLIPFLVKAIQELTADVDALEKEIWEKI